MAHSAPPPPPIFPFLLLVLESVCPLTNLPVQAKRDQRMAKPLSEVVKEVSKKDIEPWVKAIVFELSCNDTEGEDVDVRLHFYTLDTPVFQLHSSGHVLGHVLEHVHKISLYSAH